MALVTGSFDDLRSRHIRFLDEAAQHGEDLQVLLWSDAAVRGVTGSDPKFPEAERKYLLESLRAVDGVTLVNEVDNGEEFPADYSTHPGETWVVGAAED